MFLTEKHEKNTAKKERNKPKRSRFLYHEPLEERLLVSASILGLAAGAAMAGNHDTTTTDTTQTSEYRNYMTSSTDLDALSDIHLDSLSAQLGTVETEESTDENIFTSRTNDTTPEITSNFNTESSVDLTQKFGDDLLLAGIFTQIMAFNELQLQSASFDAVSFDSNYYSEVGLQPTAGTVSSEDNNDLNEALHSPQSLEFYGYSSIADDINENNGGNGPQMAFGCGCGRMWYNSSLYFLP
ncbi:MAG: hypothetical protein ACRC2T_07850 [Thermoguttaceae bacterium]